MKDVKTRVLVVIAVWTLIAVAVCCSTPLLALGLIVLLMASGKILKEVDREVYDEIFNKE